MSDLEHERTDRTEMIFYEYGEGSIEVSLDEPKSSEDELVELDEKRNILDLRGYDLNEKLEISGNLEFNIEEILGTLPKEERDSPPIDLVILAQSQRTFYREKLEKITWSKDESRDFEIEIKTCDHWGNLKLSFLLVRQREGDSSNNYASKKGARVADSDPWSLKMDDMEGLPSKGLQPKLTNFEQEDFPEHVTADQIHYLDLRDEENPDLWINSDYQPLARILDLKNHGGGYDGNRRDVFYDVISQSVYPQLVFCAINGIQENNEFNYNWQESILKPVIEDLCPDQESRDGMLNELKRARKNPQELSEKMRLLSASLQEKDGVKQNMKDLIQVGE